MLDRLLQHGVGVGGKNIKNIQRGRLDFQMNTAEVDIAINPINIDNTICIIEILAISQGAKPSDTLVLGKLTNATTLRLEREGSSENVAVVWTVVEFQNIKRIQKGVTTERFEIPIQPVNLEKSLLFTSMKSTSTGTYITEYMYAPALRNASEIVPNTQNGVTIFWYVVEF